MLYHYDNFTGGHTHFRRLLFTNHFSFYLYSLKEITNVLASPLKLLRTIESYGFAALEHLLF